MKYFSIYKNLILNNFDEVERLLEYYRIENKVEVSLPYPLFQIISEYFKSSKNLNLTISEKGFTIDTIISGRNFKIKSK